MPARNLVSWQTQLLLAAGCWCQGRGQMSWRPGISPWLAIVSKQHHCRLLSEKKTLSSTAQELGAIQRGSASLSRAPLSLFQ